MGQELLDVIAKLLKATKRWRWKHLDGTDSQGRKGMNRNLSNSRTTAVLQGIQRGRVLTRSFIVKRFGESQPIASNNTREGRETNRKIEFRL